MVCESCQDRLSKLAVPDVVKKKDSNNGNNTVAGGGVKAGELSDFLWAGNTAAVSLYINEFE